MGGLRVNQMGSLFYFIFMFSQQVSRKLFMRWEVHYKGHKRLLNSERGSRFMSDIYMVILLLLGFGFSLVLMRYLDKL